MPNVEVPPERADDPWPASHEPFTDTPHDCLAVVRAAADGRVLVAGNLADEPRSVDVPIGGRASLLVHTGDAQLAGTAVRLGPRSGAVLRLA